MKSSVVILLSLPQASIVTENVMPYSCGSCCAGLDKCKFDWSNSWSGAALNSCLNVLPEGCNLTTTSCQRVTVDDDEVCPSPVEHPADSDYVTFATSYLVGKTTYGKLADVLYIEDVLFTKQDGCSYSMIAHPAPTAFPTECSSPTIDAVTKDVAEVHLTPADTGSAFTLYLNSTLPLTSVNYISLKATGNACAPFTVLRAPTLIALLKVTMSNTGEASVVTDSVATSTVPVADSNASEELCKPLTVTTVGASASRASFTSVMAQGKSTLTASIAMTVTETGDVGSATVSSTNPTVTGLKSYDSEVSVSLSTVTTTERNASEETLPSSVVTGSEGYASEAPSTAFPDATAGSNASEDTSAAFADMSSDVIASADLSTPFTVHEKSTLNPATPATATGTDDTIPTI